MKESKGITLIALIVTIIVLIILAAVSLNVLLGQNGIIGRAQQASRVTKLAAFKEKLEMEIAAIVTDLLAEGEEPNLDNVGDKLHDLGYKVTPDEDGTLTVETDDGGKAKVHPDLTVEVEGAPNQSGGGTTEQGDTTPPTGVANYSTTVPTNGTVIVTIDIDEPIITPTGDWVMVGTDQKKYTREYTMNVTDQIVEITDLAGNVGYVTINISNIDNTNPTGMASYSPTLLTGGTVRVTITTNKEVTITQTGWTKEDATHYWKDYTGNTTETITITDLASNTGSVNVAVTNILTGVTVENPIVTGGLTPIKYNGTTWVDTTESDAEWYDYIAQTTGTASGGTSKWANARTGNGSMLVWIPRYEYKIIDGYHGYQGTSGSGTLLASGTAGTIDVSFIPASQTIADTSYTIHPAFTNSGNGGLGELSGIWVGKFESSNDGSANIKILPNVSPWTSISAHAAFTKCQSFSVNNSLIGYDSHMMKNSEWGAMAYLTHSKYGRNGTEVTINNHGTSNGKLEVELATGYAGYTVNAAEGTDGKKINVVERSVEDNTSTSGTFPYNNTYRGVLASTTGNVYGVYDMSGGAYEIVMLSYGGSTGSTGFSSIPSAKYCEIASYLPTDAGSAMYETSSDTGSQYSWFRDSASWPTSNYPWFNRGGCYRLTDGAGIFAFAYFSGAGGRDSSFRLVLTKQ